MATKIQISGNKVEAVWDDRFRPILEALGTLRIQRATDVEFDNATGEWFAIHRATGQEIARGLNREQVIREEVAWLERSLCPTT